MLALFLSYLDGVMMGGRLWVLMVVLIMSFLQVVFMIFIGPGAINVYHVVESKWKAVHS